ncbi:MAG: PII uridylyl-transferase [bacterium ADurb.Bin363]|nr:MAG: PII uridylyl-transferase [bacterium ADurb.Bin363]
MQDLWLKLEESSKKLGTHNQKYILTISKYKDELLSALERHDSLDKIHFWNLRDFSDDMDTIVDVGRNLEEKLNFLGCYYAIQFLNMNLKAVDALSMELVTSKENQRPAIYKAFMRKAGKKFRSLTASYMNTLLYLLMEGEEMPEFAICGVGARADQDDIDVGIITRERDVSKNFGLAISKLNKQMIIHSTRLHFHPAEMMGMDRYYSTIQEFWDYLSSHNHDFVFITEVLGAAKIIGSDKLFNDFRRDIVYRYFYKPYGNNIYHEAYIRGILGEIHSLLLRSPKKDYLNPKLDSIRMLKGFIYLAKIVWGLDEVNGWDILEKLKELDKEEEELYNQLEEALSSVEIFRYIYQLFIVQDEDINLNEGYVFDNMDRIATFLGYEQIGAIRPWHDVVHDYQVQVRKSHEIAVVLFDRFSSHLRRITVFSELIKESEKEEPSINSVALNKSTPMVGRFQTHVSDTVALFPLSAIKTLKPKKEEKRKMNIAFEYIKRGSFFEGNTYWDDLLEVLLEPDGKVLKRYIKDFNLLTPWRKEILIKSYVSVGKYSFYPLFMTFRALFKFGRNYGGKELFLEFNRVFLKLLPDFNDVTNRIAELFGDDPALVNDYLMVIDSEDVKIFEMALDGETATELNEILDNLKHLCLLYYSTSSYFKGFFYSILEKLPEYVKFLSSPEKLKEINVGVFGVLEDIELIKERKTELGDYYNFEFVRVAMLTFEGAPLEQINAEFTEFSDNYLTHLFLICKEEIENQEGHKIITDDLFGIYKAGGHAREQAYVDDFDVIVLLDSDDENLRKILSRIIIKMNSEIIKRGMLPHYRFAEHFGHYITMLSELEEYFQQEQDDEHFIDKSQLLGSKLLIGSRKIEYEFVDRIIRPYIFEQSEKYISQMIKDMKARHIAQKKLMKESINLKECRGGLRDIENFLLIAKAKFQIRENICDNVFNILSQKNIKYKDKIEILKKYFYFIKNLRDLYRLTVAADDEVAEDTMKYLVRFSPYRNEDVPTASKKLFNKLKVCNIETYGIIADLLQGFHISL